MIAGFFRQIGRADELGSGMRNLMKYGKVYGGEDPELIEGDVFRIIVRVPEAEEQPGQECVENHHNLAHYVRTTPQVTPQITALMKAVCKSPKTREELIEIVGVSDREHFRKTYLEPLQKTGWIEKTIPDKPTSRLQKYRLTAKGKEVLVKPLPKTYRFLETAGIEKGKKR